MASKTIPIPNRCSVYLVLDIDLKQGKNGDIQFVPIVYRQFHVHKMVKQEKKNNDGTSYEYWSLLVTPFGHEDRAPSTANCDMENFDTQEVDSNWVSMNRSYYVANPYFTSKDNMVKWATKVLKKFLAKRVKEFSSKKDIPFKEKKLETAKKSLELIEDKEFVEGLLWCYPIL